MMIKYLRQLVGDVDVFYRVAGPVSAPVILLLHGFPTASHMFRDLIPNLAQTYRVIAPDLPGFGNTIAPTRDRFEYTFDNLAQTIERFVDLLGIDLFSLYLFDYGAPVGLRIAAAQPDRIQTLIIQNGNAYVEGLSDQWAVLQTYWRDPTQAHRDACRQMLTWEFVRDGQYLYGTAPGTVSPDGYSLDMSYLSRAGTDEVQLDLLLDYQTNLAQYRRFQAYFREYQPACLVAWGRHDHAFTIIGAESYRRDLPAAEIHFLDAGHFALETHADEISSLILGFLRRQLRRHLEDALG